MSWINRCVGVLALVAVANTIDAAPPGEGIKSSNATANAKRSCRAAHRCFRIQDICATGTACSAFALNAAGQVTGWIQTGADSHAFFWNPISGDLRDIGTLGGSGSIGRAINGKGQITGDAQDADGNSHAFFWDPATDLMEDLGTLGGPNSSGVDINEAGQIAGTSDAPSDFDPTGTTSRAFFWRQDTREIQMIEPLLLGTDPEFGYEYNYGVGYSSAVAINNAGVVAGVWDGAPFPFVDTSAFFWDPRSGSRFTFSYSARVSTVDVNDLGHVLVNTVDHGGGIAAVRWDTTYGGVLGCCPEFASAMNERGQVTGSNDFGTLLTYLLHAYFWDPTTGLFVDIGALPGDPASEGKAINNLGEITGDSGDLYSQFRAFLWTGGKLWDLNTLIDRRDPLRARVVLQVGYKINDRGQILASGTRDGVETVFLLSPIEKTPRGNRAR